jgi:L-glyceraldehyde 3-phosphate reductase
LANNYGPPPGSAEENFGKMMASDLRSYRDEMIISTKAGYYMWDGPYGEWGSKKYLVSSLDQSLKRMQLDYVDIFYHHRPDPDTPLEETMMALDLIVRQGKAHCMWVYPITIPNKLWLPLNLLKQLGTPCLIHQPNYSLFNRWVEDGLLDVLEREGIGCIPFSPLAQGLLTDRYLQEIPADSRAAKAVFLKEDRVQQMLPKIKALNEIAQQRGQSLAQMALAWLLKDTRVTSVLIGASSVAQLENNLGALQNKTFSSEDLSRIEAILKP